MAVRWVKEARRSVDYLETRADLDHGKLGYYGHSWGGISGPQLLAVDDRVKAGVFVTAGVFQEDWSALPEADIMTFAPRVKVPVLMLNGEFDPFFPVETHARPLFNLLKMADKKQVIAPGGHFVPQATLIRETLAWLDKYLGPTH
jgi:cephalosporin-C deacetylase-like acetyl esterase